MLVKMHFTKYTGKAWGVTMDHSGLSCYMGYSGFKVNIFLAPMYEMRHLENYIYTYNC